MKSSCLAMIAVAFAVFAPTARADVPGSIEVTCDVDLAAFKGAARNEAQVTFRLWDGADSGPQCGTSHVVDMQNLVVTKARTYPFDGERSRRFLRIETVLGSDSTPIDFAPCDQVWMEIVVGSQMLTCDASSSPAQARRRLHGVAFAQEAPGGGDGVSLVETGNGLQGGPISDTGTISVDAPSCSGSSNKLTWTGTAFGCGLDQTGGGGSVPTGAIILWEGPDCPLGFSSVTAYNDKFLVGSGTPGVEDGTNTHDHGGATGAHALTIAEIPPHRHDVATSAGGSLVVPECLKSNDGCNQGNEDLRNTEMLDTGGGQGHTHGISSADSRPAFRTIKLCRKD